MSHSCARAVLDNGCIVGFLEYNGTVDQLWTPIIRASEDEVKLHWRGPEGCDPATWQPCGCAGDDAVIQVDYTLFPDKPGFISFPTRVCLTHMRVVGQVSRYQENTEPELVGLYK